jgi:hypothetical protein
MEESGGVKPVATIMGTLMNSGWYQSSGIGQNFGFSISLPVFLSYVSKKDHYYTTYRASGCANASSTVSCGYPDYRAYKVPTVIGPKVASGQVFEEYVLDENYEPADIAYKPVSDGLTECRNMGTYPFAMPQASFAYRNTELKLRYLFLPRIRVSRDSAYLKASIFGVGLQHDLTSFLGELPFTISIGSSLSFWGIKYTPEKYTGRLTLSGITNFTGFVAGKSFGAVETFAEIGWETSHMQVGGRIVGKSDTSAIEEPDVSVFGRNGFRMAINFAFHLGYQPVLGQNIGSQLGHQINLLIYRKEG